MTEQTEIKRPESITNLLALIGRMQAELKTANVERCELQDRINELEEELADAQRMAWQE